MIAFADAAYGGSAIYAVVTPNVTFIVAVAILMTAVLAVGLIRRERKGFGNIGVESYLIAAIYVAGIGVVLIG